MKSSTKPLLLLATSAALMFCGERASAQSNTSQAVQHVQSGNKVFLEINAIQLESELNELFQTVTSTDSDGPDLSWSDVLGNGSNPGMDINFSSYDITGLGGLTATGTLIADSLSLSKDADITGTLSVTNVVNFNDSLTVKGYVELSDSLEVVRAVTVGETLYVTGVTSLGDSLHVAGNVDLDALFNVDGAATFGSTITVTGQTTLNDSLHVNSGANIAGALYADSISVTDVINGQVNSLGNHSTDGLAEGTTNLYFTDSRAQDAMSAGTGVTLTAGEIAIGQSVGTTDDVTFSQLLADSVSSATFFADSIGAYNSGTLNLGATTATWSASNALTLEGGTTSVSMSGSEIAVSGDVDADGSLTVSGQSTLNDSLHLNSGANITGDVVVNDTNLLQIIASLEARIAALEAGGGETPSASFTCGTSTVTFDGHDYSTVQIGSQCWFAENLRTTKYADGSSIAEVTDNSVWTSTNDGARAAYDNDASNVTTYGYLYNWSAVDSDAGLCPTDWHVPTDEEWTALTTELGGESVAGNKMKSSSSDSPSWDGNNSSGFSALPGGLRYDYDGSFDSEGLSGVWWSASPDGTSLAWYRDLYSVLDGVARSSNFQRSGFSVRCLRDE